MQGTVTTMADDNYKVTNSSKAVVVKPDLLAVVLVLVDDDDVDAAKEPPPPAASPPFSPPVAAAAVVPADNKQKSNKVTTTTPPPPPPPPAEVPMLLVIVYLWALANAVVFAVGDIATLIVNRTPCTKSTWLFPCVEIPDAAAAELTALTYAQLLAAALRMLLLELTTTTAACPPPWTLFCHAWVALAATAGMHCMEVAADRIVLATTQLNAGDKKFVLVDLVFGCVGLAVDLLLVAVLLLLYRCCCCCTSPRHRRRMGLDLGLGDDYGEV